MLNYDKNTELSRGENKLSDGNESVMSANLEEEAQVSKSWHPYLKLYFAHHFDALLIVESILLALCHKADEKDDCEALSLPVCLCEHTSSSSISSLLT